MFTPVRTISFVLDFDIFFARLTVWLIEALLLFPLASGIVQKEQK